MGWQWHQLDHRHITTPAPHHSPCTRLTGKTARFSSTVSTELFQRKRHVFHQTFRVDRIRRRHSTCQCHCVHLKHSSDRSVDDTGTWNTTSRVFTYKLTETVYTVIIKEFMLRPLHNDIAALQQYSTTLDFITAWTCTMSTNSSTNFTR